MEPQSKTCTQCSKSLPLTDFYRDRTIYTKIAYRSKCKLCCSRNNEQRKKHNINETLSDKTCKLCNQKKKISEFYKSYRHIDGYFSECISCIEIKRKNKGQNQKIKRTPEYMIQYISNRKKEPNFKMRYALRSNLKAAVCRVQKGVKSERTMKYVDCSLDFLKLWFEFLFTKEMNWGNHGTYWHIDHIKPCSSFDLTKQEEIYKCYHWSNLRPLNKDENLTKGDKINEQLIEEYEDLKESFLGQISNI